MSPGNHLNEPITLNMRLNRSSAQSRPQQCSRFIPRQFNAWRDVGKSKASRSAIAGGSAPRLFWRKHPEAPGFAASFAVNAVFIRRRRHQIAGLEWRIAGYPPCSVSKMQITWGGQPYRSPRVSSLKRAQLKVCFQMLGQLTSMAFIGT